MNKTPTQTPHSLSLFADNETNLVHKPELQDADLQYYSQFYTAGHATKLYHSLMNELSFNESQIQMFGKTVTIPRLQAWHGHAGLTYTYSSTTLVAEPWTTTLQSILKNVSEHCSHDFNAVLCNLYRDGQDSVGWHADNEPELGEQPIIASLSFGEARMFQMRHKQDKSNTWRQILEHGSLLMMKGNTQKYWLHQLPKTTVFKQPRINLTFRKIYA